MTAGPPGRLDAEEACDAFAAALDPVRAEAAAAGVPLALEHNHALRRDIGFLHTLRDMVEYAEEIDLGIVVELNNCWIERRLPDTFRRGASRFSVVQVSDYAIGTSAGSLFVTGALLLLAAGWVWRRGLPRRWWSFAGATLLILLAPYLVRYFGRGTM